MCDLTQALAERVPGWDYRVEPAQFFDVDGPIHGWSARASLPYAARISRAWHDTPAGAVRMLNDALRETA
jgi:hypothetical protein